MARVTLFHDHFPSFNNQQCQSLGLFVRDKEQRPAWAMEFIIPFHAFSALALCLKESHYLFLYTEVLGRFMWQEEAPALTKNPYGYYRKANVSTF